MLACAAPFCIYFRPALIHEKHIAAVNNTWGLAEPPLHIEPPHLRHWSHRSLSKPLGLSIITITALCCAAITHAMTSMPIWQPRLLRLPVLLWWFQLLQCCWPVCCRLKGTLLQLRCLAWLESWLLN